MMPRKYAASTGSESVLPFPRWILITAIVMALFFVALCVGVTTVSAGYVGIVVTFGAVQDYTLQPGLHVIDPFALVYHMRTQTQLLTMVEEVPSKEGMSIHLEAAILFRLLPSEAAKMYSTVGLEYIDAVVRPQFRSALRTVTSAHDAKDLYTAKAREDMTHALNKDMTAMLKSRGLIVEDILLKSIVLPKTLQSAIQQKLTAEQSSQQMEFVLQKERQEAERKAIEAQGIQDFQNIVRQGIDDNLLRWKGIEATEQLAASTNSKIVVIGGGTEGGLPLILNPKE